MIFEDDYYELDLFMRFLRFNALQNKSRCFTISFLKEMFKQIKTYMYMYKLDKSSLFFEYKMMMFRANMYLINYLNFDSIYFYLIHMLYKQTYFDEF